MSSSRFAWPIGCPLASGTNRQDSFIANSTSSLHPARDLAHHNVLANQCGRKPCVPLAVSDLQQVRPLRAMAATKLRHAERWAASGIEEAWLDACPCRLRWESRLDTDRGAEDPSLGSRPDWRNPQMAPVGLPSEAYGDGL